MGICATLLYLVSEPDESGLLVVSEHPIFRVQEFFHDEQEELFSHTASIYGLLSHEDHLQNNTIKNVQSSTEEEQTDANSFTLSGFL